MPNELIAAGDLSATMTSLEIAELTGKRHDNVMADIRKMLVELYAEGGVLKFQDTQRNPQNGQEYPVFRLPRREVEILVTGYSITLRAKVIDRLRELEAPRSLTAAEQLLAHVQITVELERRQQQTEQQVAALVETVGDMDRAHPLLDSIPNGMESITAIRQRIGKLYGLPPRVIDAVVREMPHSPRPFAMVRSKHEELNARPFAVWSKAEITRVFERFAQGCTFVTKHRATHPDFLGGAERFQMRGEPAGEVQP